ncbi:hypothetical protein BN997_01127 [Oceanobacillus oncorhynchi]|uniref:Uncharacterized protein n=1 Tax=Oceanobacillus oncorhynchi TaxID=545501 RepID=A0A0A1MNH6_9BACI|nr:hypothetical protein [Oceanobacillus oncorhynchi]CEI81309.1 hypothetical protein BN997_01127 [Oceanobacillus oncorhynchi]
MKVNIKVKQDNTVETIQHEVQSINVFQFQKTLKGIKNIIGIINEDEALKQTFTDMFAAENQDEELSVTYVIARAAGAFEAVLINIPDEGFELLATLSGLEKKTLMEQKVEDVFDIYDAVLEVNDIEKIVERAKKSFAATKKATKFMRKRVEATAQKQA